MDETGLAQPSLKQRRAAARAELASSTSGDIAASSLWLEVLPASQGPQRRRSLPYMPSTAPPAWPEQPPVTSQRLSQLLETLDGSARAARSRNASTDAKLVGGAEPAHTAPARPAAAVAAAPTVPAARVKPRPPPPPAKPAAAPLQRHVSFQQIVAVISPESEPTSPAADSADRGGASGALGQGPRATAASVSAPHDEREGSGSQPNDAPVRVVLQELRPDLSVVMPRPMLHVPRHGLEEAMAPSPLATPFPVTGSDPSRHTAYTAASSGSSDDAGGDDSDDPDDAGSDDVASASATSRAGPDEADDHETESSADGLEYLTFEDDDDPPVHLSRLLSRAQSPPPSSMIRRPVPAVPLAAAHALLPEEARDAVGGQLGLAPIRSSSPGSRVSFNPVAAVRHVRDTANSFPAGASREYPTTAERLPPDPPASISPRQRYDGQPALALVPPPTHPPTHSGV